jgi:hypothetical protein
MTTTPPATAPAQLCRACAVIDEALADGPPRRIEDLLGLAAELRAHLDMLLPAAEQHLNTLWRGDPLWYSRRTTLDDIRRLLEAGLGDGLKSATRHVRDLACACRKLLGWLGDASEPADAAALRAGG